MTARILVTEDDRELNKTISDLLSKEGYFCKSFENPVDALKLAEKQDFDLLLADLKLPEFDGIELTRKVQKIQPDIRALIITAYSSMPSVIEALRIGVDNYILKPFNSKELLFQIKRALERQSLILENRRYQENLERLVEERTTELINSLNELNSSQIENIFAIGNIIEARDTYTRGHTERVTIYAVAMAEKLGWDERRIRELGIGSPLHDIGKIGVPDSILKKEGPLNFREYEMMKDHPTIGYDLVRDTDLSIGTTACILYHHERYDGKGYPFGLAGNSIPEEGRIMAICDAFDAMTSNRVYRKAMQTEKALSIVMENAGSQFDPDFAIIFKDLVYSDKIDRQLQEADLTGTFGELLARLTETQTPAEVM